MQLLKCNSSNLLLHKSLSLSPSFSNFDSKPVSQCEKMKNYCAAHNFSSSQCGWWLISGKIIVSNRFCDAINVQSLAYDEHEINFIAQVAIKEIKPINWIASKQTHILSLKWMNCCHLLPSLSGYLLLNWALTTAALGILFIVDFLS